MKHFILVLLVLATCLKSTQCFGQTNWLNVAPSALPKINFGGQAGFPSTTPVPPTTNYNTSGAGLPSSTGFPSNLGYPATTGYGPSLVANRKDWKLGVYVQSTDVGAVVTQVAPGSAGQQSGIEPNDVIVAVGGNRIGSFDNRIVELADEIRQNTDPTGRVSLLVLDSRQRVLKSLPVVMSSASSTLTGSVMTRDRMQLPYGTMLTVQIQNVSKPYYEIAGGKSVTRADGFGPFTFELNLDPRYLSPQDQYQVSASIFSGNQELYRLPQPIAFNLGSLGQAINLTLDRSNGLPPSGNTIPGNTIPGNTIPGNSFPGSSGNAINAGYPSTLDSNAMTQLFLQLLGRAPSTREVLAWQAYLQQGNSIDDLKIKLLSSSQFRERFGSDSAYVQQLITTVMNRTPNQQELAYWMGRLQSTGSPETIIGEMLMKSR